MNVEGVVTHPDCKEFPSKFIVQIPDSRFQIHLLISVAQRKMHKCQISTVFTNTTNGVDNFPIITVQPN